MGKVQLSVKGEGGVPFSNTTAVEFDGKTASLFVQTDKAKYKPGQEVRIRVLVLDPHLKPTIREPINVFVLVSYKSDSTEIEGTLYCN